VFQPTGFPGNNQDLGGERRSIGGTVRSCEHRGSIQIGKWGRRERIGHRILLEDESVLADGNHVRVMKLVACDGLSLDGRAVGALQVFEKKTA